MKSEGGIDSKIKKYFSLTEEALKKVKIAKKLSKKDYKIAEDYLRLSKSYYEDAKFFNKKKDRLNAFAALCYAHAFLDAGAISGVFDVKDNKLFMVD